MSQLTAIIIAGGSNSRFFPLNTYLHKGGFSLLGRPLIHRTLDGLTKLGVERVICVLSAKDSGGQGLGEVIDQYLAGSVDGKSQPEVIKITQPESKGMGDAILLAKEHLQFEKFLVVSPHYFLVADLGQKLLNAGSSSALLVSETDQPWLYGVVEVTDERAISIVEKPELGRETSKLRLQSLYLLDRAYLEILEQTPDEHYNFELALNKYLQQNQVKVVHLDQAFPSLKFAWHLFDLLAELFQTEKSFTHPQAKVAQTALIDDTQGPVIIAEGAKIGDFAKVVGPCYLGKNSLIGDYSFVRGSCLEEDATVGANTEVVRSIIFENSTIHYGYLADSIVGRNNRIGAGLITANKRLDRDSVKTLIKGEKVDTKRQALGVITGQEVNLGIRVSTMPGVMIGEGNTIEPGAILKKNLEHRVKD